MVQLSFKKLKQSFPTEKETIWENNYVSMNKRLIIKQLHELGMTI